MAGRGIPYPAAQGTRWLVSSPYFASTNLVPGRPRARAEGWMLGRGNEAGYNDTTGQRQARQAGSTLPLTSTMACVRARGRAAHDK